MQNLDEIFQSFLKIAIRIDQSIKNSNSDYSNNKNSSGDNQLKLDIDTDLIVAEELSKLSIINSIASEEKKDIININKNGRYTIAYDPLDGSSIINSNFSVGSIFGIYEGSIDAKNLISGAYIIYGPKVEMVFSLNKTKLYVLQNYKFEFIKTLHLKKSGNINATGGTQKFWSEKHKLLILNLFNKGYRLRYSGGMVPDLHNILIKGGGLFSYPKTDDAPNGKLRKAFEVFPFAKIFECAGGVAICESGDLLKLPIKDIHETTDCYFGSIDEINMVKKTYE